MSRAFSTLVIHAGQEPDPATGAVMQPIVLSSTFAQPAPGQPIKYDYSRSGNPTRDALEACVAALEYGDHGFAFASGTAASLTLLNVLKTGDEILCGDDLYGGTVRLFDKVLAPLGVVGRRHDLSDLDAVEKAITPKTKMIWFETPTNPMLKLFDIEALSKIARARDLILVVDNTFASPALQSPLKLGAHVVLHSTTKYINGHSDVVGGAVVTSEPELAERLRFLQNAMGAVPSPMDCYMVLRGIKTLALRMERHSQSAMMIAERLEKHAGVKRVIYPGLPSHPDHELCKKQMRSGGGMISVDLADPTKTAEFLQALEIFKLAESLGGVESLAEHPAGMTHASVPEAEREQLGIGDGLVRLSVGIEDPEDLWADLDRGLQRVL